MAAIDEINQPKWAVGAPATPVATTPTQKSITPVNRANETAIKQPGAPDTSGLSPASKKMWDDYYASFDKAKQASLAASGSPTAAPAAPGAPAGTSTPSFSSQAQAIADSGQYQANTGAFNEATGVEGRVARISNSDNPLMQLAGTRAKQQANRSGLLNTSMAVGAGQNAVLDAALPIAQADAGAYQQQSLTNQQSLNEAAMRNAAARASAGTEGMRLGESARQFDADRTQKEGQFEKGMAHDVNMAGINRQTQEALAGIEAKYRTEIAGNENIANAWGTTMADISKIQNNPDLDPATKTSMIQNTINGFQSFSNFWKKATGGAVDVSDLLSFGITADEQESDSGSNSGGGAGTNISTNPVMSAGDWGGPGGGTAGGTSGGVGGVGDAASAGVGGGGW